eukprot:CAMPEP_0197657516 /NCGR_PEP_ID=MMETSP1338-20131121/44677_1 /TAXON_ID=43686 ORGANISM="Pelagodinium beii, Strain RCC1491" /NCGR_SAMPLE_ID=MMETSP1338 /ASSEMBLY_ACC=CAM_ASM_000754 /LENGTH=541 /DNA_ID=CAMNT_0043233907 /DNA_START=42 /DNA_END=1667 /DNA_ORIENTATION=-
MAVDQANGQELSQEAAKDVKEPEEQPGASAEDEPEGGEEGEVEAEDEKANEAAETDPEEAGSEAGEEAEEEEKPKVMNKGEEDDQEDAEIVEEKAKEVAEEAPEEQEEEMAEEEAQQEEIEEEEEEEEEEADEQAQEEEEMYEEEVEEEEAEEEEVVDEEAELEEEEAEGAEDEVMFEEGEQFNDAEDWPAPNSVRPNGMAGRRWKVPVEEAVAASPSGKSASSSAGVSGSAVDRKEIRRLEKENKALRLEIGQERFKVQQLQKMQADANRAQRSELEARKREAMATRELEEAKRYVSKRHSFAMNEKAEMLRQIQDLEKRVQEATDKELALRFELQEASSMKSSSADRQENWQKEAERWRKDSSEQSAKLKKVEAQVQQLEDRKISDKAKMKALADQLRAAMDAGFVPAGSPKALMKRPSSPTKDAKVLEVPAPLKKGLVQSDAAKKSSLRDQTARGAKPQEPRSCCGRRSRPAQPVGNPAKARDPPGGHGGSKEKLLKSGKSRASKAEFDLEDPSARQNSIIGVLVAFVACLAMAKLYL